MQPSNTICAHDRLRCFENAVVGQKYCTNHLKENKVDVNKLDLKLCGYVSGRTLLQCTNFRREEQLDKNGFCEQHINYIKRLKSDLERTRRLLDPGLKKEPRDFIDQDEEETLDVDGDWPYTMDSAYCDSRVADDDDDPLRNAGVFTHKEIIKRQIAALEREKQALLEFHELLAERLRRLDLKHAKQVKSGKKKKKIQQVVKEDEKLYVDAQNAALAKYGSHINWKSVENFLGKCDEKKKLLENPLEKDSGGAEVKSKCVLLERQPGYCSHFELVKVKKSVRMSPKIKQAAEPLEFNDFESRLCLDNMFSSLGINPPITEPDAQIKSLVNLMLDEIERSETESIIGGQENDQIEIEVKHFCPYKVLPLSDFCAGHILEDQKQFVYSKCSEVGCTQICFVYENACTVHAKATPPPRPRRKAILSVDSLSNIPSSSELRPRSYTDVQLQPSTSSGFPINFPMGGEPKGILRRGRPPNQPPKMLPFLAKPGQIIGSPTNFIVTSTGQSSPQGFITVPATPRTPLLSPKIVSKKPPPKNRDDSSSDENDSGKPVRRVVIDSSEDEEIEAKKPRIENAIDESIDSVASQSFSQPTVPGRGSRRFKTPWAKKAESLHAQPLSSLPLVQAAPNKPQFRNNVLPPPGQATPNMGQKGQMMKPQPQGRQLFQNSDETCARVQPFSGRKDKTKETGNVQKNNGSTVEPGTYDRLLQNSGMDMNSPVFATPSNVRYTPVAQQQPPRFISHSAEAGGYGYSSQTQVNAKLTYGRVKPASQLMSGTNLSNVPPNVQTPFKAADQKYSTQQTLSPEQQHQPQNVSTQSSLPQTHIPAEHDYTSFRHPQPRIRQPSIRRIQYNMPVNSEFQPRSTTLYRTRYPNPRARIITVPTPAQFNPIRHQRAIGPRTISLHPVNSNNASGISPGTNINAQNVGAAANNNMQSQTGAPIYVNGGKQIYLKGIDIGSIQNVHTARYAPTNIVTKRRIIADGVITHQHPIKQPRKQQFQTTGTTGTYNHYSRTLDTIPSYPPHHNSMNHHDQNVENSSLPINVNQQTPQYQQLQPIVETKSPPVGLTPQQILAHDHDFSFSKLPLPKETPTNGPNSETNNALEMLADVSVSQGRRTSTSCARYERLDKSSFTSRLPLSEFSQSYPGIQAQLRNWNPRSQSLTIPPPIAHTFVHRQPCPRHIMIIQRPPQLTPSVLDFVDQIAQEFDQSNLIHRQTSTLMEIPTTPRKNFIRSSSSQGSTDVGWISPQRYEMTSPVEEQREENSKFVQDEKTSVQKPFEAYWSMVKDSVAFQGSNVPHSSFSHLPSSSSQFK